MTDEELEETAVPEHTEPEPVVEAKPVYTEPPKKKADFTEATKAQPAEEVDSSLFKSFSVGDVKQMQSTPDNKPPF